MATTMKLTERMEFESILLYCHTIQMLKYTCLARNLIMLGWGLKKQVKIGIFCWIRCLKVGLVGRLENLHFFYSANLSRSILSPHQTNAGQMYCDPPQPQSNLSPSLPSQLRLISGRPIQYNLYCKSPHLS